MEMERRRHSLAHTRALLHKPFHASTAHPSPPIPIITSTSATPPRIYARTRARTLPTRRTLHAVIPILQGKASARAPLHLSINQMRPQDSISALSLSFFPCAMSCSQGLQYTSSALSAYVLWCGSSCSQGCQEIFSALPLHCSLVSTELPSRLATFRLRLPASFFGCALSSSQGFQDIFSTLSTTLYMCVPSCSQGIQDTVSAPPAKLLC